MESATRISRLIAITLVLATNVHAGGAEISMSPPGATAYIVQPSNGEKVSGEFKIVFGLSGMGVAPAGVVRENTGHHHLLIDLEELPDMQAALPATEHIRHFGGGQTETLLTLEPGEHTLQLLLGNHAHIPHDKPVLSERINIVVEE